MSIRTRENAGAETRAFGILLFENRAMNLKTKNPLPLLAREGFPSGSSRARQYIRGRSRILSQRLAGKPAIRG